MRWYVLTLLAIFVICGASALAYAMDASGAPGNPSALTSSGNAGEALPAASVNVLAGSASQPNDTATLLSLQTQINANAANRTKTVVIHDYDGGSPGYTYYLPNNTLLDGRNHKFKNISFVVKNSNNVSASGIVNDGSSITKAPFRVEGACDKVTFTSCVVNNSRTKYSGFLILPNPSMSNLSIVSCRVSDVDRYGYEIAVSGGTSPISMTDVYFYNDTAVYCGYYNRSNDWCVGYDFDEFWTTTPFTLKNALIKNCTAAYNWESGFHEEVAGAMVNVTFDGCTSHDNAIKPKPTYGSGFLIHASNLVRCTSYNNYIGFRSYDAKPPTLPTNITSCVEYDSTYMGLEAQGQLLELGHRSDGGVILNNVSFTDDRRYGLYINDSDNIRTTNVRVVNATGDSSYMNVIRFTNNSNFNVNTTRGKSAAPYTLVFNQVRNSTLAANSIRNGNVDAVTLKGDISSFTMT